MEKRSVKKFIIILLYLFLIISLGFIVLTLVKPKPTCNDGIKNQLEEGIDCGGPCAPCEENLEIEDISIQEIEWVDTATDKIDVVASIKNPNSLFGASTLRYRINFFDLQGQKIYETRWLKDFILPQQEKYLLAQEIEVPGSPAEVKVEIGDVDWKKFTTKEQNPRLEVILTEFGDSFRKDVSGFYRVTGTLVNESSLDLEVIKIKVVLRNAKGDLLATNSQVVNTVYSKEKRDFNIPFPSDYNMSEVTKVEIKPETNIFDSDNTVKFYGISEDIDY